MNRHAKSLADALPAALTEESKAELGTPPRSSRRWEGKSKSCL